MHFASRRVAVAALLLALVAPFGPALAADPAPVPLISRDILFGNPERTSPQISPDGKKLAWIAPDEKNVLQVWVKTLGQEDGNKVTADRKRGIRNYLWAQDDRTLLYLQDSDGDENFHVFGVDLVSGNVRDLTPFQGVQATPINVSQKVRDRILVTMNLRDRRLMDVHVEPRKRRTLPRAEVVMQRRAEIFEELAVGERELDRRLARDRFDLRQPRRSARLGARDERLGCRAVLLKPAITPARDLEAHLGRQPVYFTGEEIDFRPEYLAELREIDTPVITRPDRYFLVAATGDALIDYRAMTERYKGARQRVVAGGNHELSDFALYMDEVLDFCGIGEATGGRQ